MHQTHKSGLTKVQMFDEKFARELTSSNSVKHDFFFCVGLNASFHPHCYHEILYTNLNLKINYPPPYEKVL